MAFLFTRLRRIVNYILQWIWRRSPFAAGAIAIKPADDTTGQEQTPPPTPVWAQEKVTFLSLELSERRNSYRCGHSYVTLDNVPTWAQYFDENELWLRKLADGKLCDLKDVDADLCNSISIWRGDITTLEIDCIVNAANKTLLGGGGVDGAIHKAAGPHLVDECSTLDGCSTGQAKITGAYSLPAKYVIHTVGPIEQGDDLLVGCYLNSLNLMKDQAQRSIAFPCISTGIYGFPNERAANLALKTARNFLENNRNEVDRIIFCLFMPNDVEIYERLMQKYFPVRPIDPRPQTEIPVMDLPEVPGEDPSTPESDTASAPIVPPDSPIVKTDSVTTTVESDKSDAVTSDSPTVIEDPQTVIDEITKAIDDVITEDAVSDKDSEPVDHAEATDEAAVVDQQAEGMTVQSEGIAQSVENEIVIAATASDTLLDASVGDQYSTTRQEDVGMDAETTANADQEKPDLPTVADVELRSEIQQTESPKETAEAGQVQQVQEDVIISQDTPATTKEEKPTDNADKNISEDENLTTEGEEQIEKANEESTRSAMEAVQDDEKSIAGQEIPTIEIEQATEESDISITEIQPAEEVEIATGDKQQGSEKTDDQSVEADMKDKEANVPTKDADVSTREADVSTREADVSTNEADVSTRETDVSIKEADVSTKEADGSTREADVSTKEADVSTREADVSTKEADVSTREADVPTKEADVSTREADVPTKEADVSTKEADVSTKEADVPTKEADVSTRVADVPTKEADVSTREADVSTKEEEADEPAKGSDLLVESSKESDVPCAQSDKQMTNAIEDTATTNVEIEKASEEIPQAIEEADEHTENIEQPREDVEMHSGGNDEETGEMTANTSDEAQAPSVDKITIGNQITDIGSVESREAVTGDVAGGEAADSVNMEQVDIKSSLLDGEPPKIIDGDGATGPDHKDLDKNDNLPVDGKQMNDMGDVPRSVTTPES